MHEAIVIYLQCKVKILLDGESVCLFGESGPVPDENKYWQRAIENINIAPQDMNLLILYDCLTHRLLECIDEYLLEMKEVRIMPLAVAARYMKALYGTRSFEACGILFKENDDGWSFEYIRDCLLRQHDSFSKLFSPLTSIEDIQRELTESKKNIARTNNKLKSLQKKLER